jgi:hypothetical protein
VSRSTRRAFGVLAVATAGLLVAGSAVAVAAKPRLKPVKHLARAGVHADVSLIRADGTTDAFAVDRGQVTASSPTSVTLQRRDGKSVTLAITTDTKVRGQIQVNRGALAFSRGGTAFHILAPRGPVPAIPALPTTTPAQQHGGVVHADVSFIRADGTTNSRTFDRGQVTSSSQTSVTLQRKDGKSVTLAVNASTWVFGKLAAGGNAIVISKDGAALTIFARGPKA